MIQGGGTIGYFGYAIALWLMSGATILLIDARDYKNRSMAKEEKFAKFTGWFNVILALSVFLGRWILRFFV